MTTRIFQACMFIIGCLMPLTVCASADLPISIDDSIAGWRVASISAHAEFIRIGFEQDADATEVEIVPKGNANDQWSTAYYRVMPAPKASPPEELLQSVRTRLAEWETQPGHRPVVAFVPKQTPGMQRPIPEPQQSAPPSKPHPMWPWFLGVLLLFTLSLFLLLRWRLGSRVAAQNTVIVIVAILVGLLLSEWVARYVHLGPDLFSVAAGGSESSYRLSDNPILGYELKPNERITNPDNHNQFAYTNRHGFRDHEREYEKPAGMRRIILLGDSVVAGHDVQSLGDLIASRLQERLDASRWEVLSMGIGGYCTRNEAELLKLKGVAYAPDIVVMIFVEGDSGNHNDDLQLYWASQLPLVDWLFTNSRLARTAILVLDREWPGLFGEMKSELLKWQQGAMSRQAFEDGMKVFHSLADTYGFQPLIAVWPDFYADWKDFRYEMERADPEVQRLSESAHKLGIPVTLLVSAFRESYLKRIQSGEASSGARAHQETLAKDGLHVSPEGAKVAAEALHGWLMPFLQAAEHRQPTPNTNTAGAARR